MKTEFSTGDKIIGGSAEDSALGIWETTDGGYIIAGGLKSY